MHFVDIIVAQLVVSLLHVLFPGRSDLICDGWRLQLDAYGYTVYVPDHSVLLVLFRQSLALFLTEGRI